MSDVHTGPILAAKVLIPDGSYVIVNLVSGTALKPQDNSEANGAYIVGFDRTGPAGQYSFQQWTVTYVSDAKAYKIINIGTGKSLSTAQEFTPWRDETTVYLNSEVDYFEIQQGTQNGSYYIVPLNYKPQVLDLYQGKAENNTNVTVKDVAKPEASASLNQQWSFIVFKKAN